MLVEVLVGMILMSIVGVLVLDGITGGFKSQRQLTDRSQALESARRAAQRVTREVREANPVIEATASRLRVRRSDGAGGTVLVTFELTGTALTRQVTRTTAAGVATAAAATTVIDSLDGTTLPFLYEARSGYTPPTGVSAACVITGSSPLAYASDCIGKVTLRVVRTVKNHTSVSVEATVDVRNEA